ncbi:MAG: T9SS type A sorting domain-containing protein, partial [Bacteroidales bacterium]|nr:T9SS type A sorting domain-containing protein [Bacteroidales bacterium]
VSSNDPDFSEIEIPVYFHVDFASGEDLISKEEIQISNYPNPFDKQTTFEVNILEPTFVTLEIYNYSGQMVQSLVSKDFNSGQYTFTWKGDGFSGESVKSGIYFYRLKAGQVEKTDKLILLD